MKRDWWQSPLLFPAYWVVDRVLDGLFYAWEWIESDEEKRRWIK